MSSPVSNPTASKNNKHAAECIDDGFKDEDKKTSKTSEEKNLEKMTAAVKTLLECVGEDPDREGLLKTPLRMAKALQFFTKGYNDSLEGMF